MPIAKVGDINLCYNILGDGQPLIVITGFASAQNTLFTLGACPSNRITKAVGL